MRIKGNLIEDINNAVRRAEETLAQAGVEDKQCRCFRISLEEILLLYSQELGGDTPFSLSCKKRNGDMLIELKVPGRSFEPAASKSRTLERALEPLRKKPQWQYRNGENRVSFVFTLYNTARKYMAFAWGYTKNHRSILFLSVLCQFVAAVLCVVAPAISSRIIVSYANHEADRVMLIALTLLVVMLLQNLFNVLSNLGYNKAYMKTLTALEKDIVRGVLQVENHCMEEKGSGLFIQRITTDTGRIAAGFSSIADMVAQVFNYVGVLIAMFLINPMICMLVLVLMASQCIMELLRTRHLYRDDRVFRSANEKFTGLVGEMVRGAKDVKLLNCEETFSTELETRIQDANFKRMNMQKRSWKAKLLRWELGDVGSFILFALLAYLITKSLLLPSIALVLYNYYSQLGPNAVKVIGSFMDSIADFNISNERVYALLNSEEFPKEQFGSKELETPKGEIVFDHVRFAYESSDATREERMILNDMCFTIRPGEMVGLVGKSGCGKSTVFNLITKLYEAQGGRVLLDGVDVKKLTKDSIRNSMTVVSQNPYIFRMSVRDNLKIVKSDLTDEEMREVCRLACIEEDILLMPDGYDTVVGEGGVNMSGGQRQRLAIARSMLRNSRIILFDEATSALDNLTQAKIQQAIENMREGRTVVIIAHRLSTISNADKIMFMQDGRILTEGTHQELLERCEPYQTLAAMEQGEEAEN